MKIKTFYAQTMAEALRDIKAELGPDALLLSTRETPRRSGVTRSTFEIVAAVDSPDPDVAVPSTPAPKVVQVSEAETEGKSDDAVLPAPVTYSPASMLRDAPRAARKKAPAKPRAAARNRVPRPKPLEPADAADGIRLELVARGVSAEVSDLLLRESLQCLTARQRRSRSSLVRALRNVAEQLIASNASETGMPGKRVVVFFGPTGVGKTTSIAKLAARLALRDKKRVVLITLDGYRIGAVEQLRTYAALMGVPFRFVRHVSDLQAALEEQREKDYVLVDTAGRAPRDGSAIRELAAIAHASSEMERHLVLSATTKSADLQEIIDRFEPCKADHLLFTKLDETAAAGGILTELVRTRKSPSYYTDGQRVPEDFHVLPKGRIIDIVLNQN
jgi:flagellar biosynthesis protein FlhF